MDHPEQVGFCKPFSADWWLTSSALLMILATLRFGSPAIVLFLGCVGAIIWRNPGLALKSLFLYAPLMCVPLYAMASSAWSDAPSVSLKQGLELLLFFACAIVLARRISETDFAGALLGPAVLICAGCLFVQPGALHGQPLVGLFGSKNIMAFVAQALTGSGLAVALDAGGQPRLRLAGLVGLALGLLEVVLAKSAGAWVTTAVLVLALVLLRFAGRLTLGARLATLIGVAVILLPLALAHQQVAVALQGFQEHVLHKDATLTGRTGLWTVAHSLIAERPWIGHGYASFWQQGNLDAEALWRTMGIGARGGFNFHNEFIETTVEYGYIGLSLFIAILAWVGLSSLARATLHPSTGGAFFSAMIIALYAKLPVESVLIGPWSVFTLIWIAGAVHAAAPIADARAAASSRAGVAWRG